MEKTANFNLNQWDPHDEIKVEDFNADNAAVDAALGEVVTQINSKADIITGVFRGDGNTSQFIALGATPKAVITWQEGYKQYDGQWTFGSVAVTGNNSNAATITEGGFIAKQNADSYIFGNLQNARYFYIAFL